MPPEDNITFKLRHWIEPASCVFGLHIIKPLRTLEEISNTQRLRAKWDSIFFLLYVISSRNSTLSHQHLHRCPISAALSVPCSSSHTCSVGRRHLLRPDDRPTRTFVFASGTYAGAALARGSAGEPKLVPKTRGGIC